MNITVDTKDFENFAARLGRYPKTLNKRMYQTFEKTQNRFIKNVKNKILINRSTVTWRLYKGFRKSAVMNFGGFFIALVENIEKHAKYIEYGTGIYPPGGSGSRITGKNGYLVFPLITSKQFSQFGHMAFYWKSRGGYYVKISSSKGQPPRFFMTLSAYETRSYFHRQLSIALSKSFKKLGD